MDKAQISFTMEICTQDDINMVGQYVTFLGLPHGFGVYRWTNGSLFTGEFKQGLKHG
jgi:hypothetical protein